MINVMKYDRYCNCWLCRFINWFNETRKEKKRIKQIIKTDKKYFKKIYDNKI